MEKPDKDKDRECRNINELKKEYDKLREKYTLPEFYELNKLFDIEEIDFETDFLLRKIRRVIVDKITNYQRFVEVILNPSNSPLFFFKLIKKLDNNDKEMLANLYEELGSVEVEVIALDLEYDEKNEADVIGRLYVWFNSKIRNELLNIINKLTGNEDTGKEKINGSYFG